MTDALLHRVQALGRATRMLAIVGAAAKLRGAAAADPAVARQIERGLRLVLGTDAAAFEEAALEPLLTAIEMAFAESGELLRDPGRAGGWTVEDPQLLQAMGRASSSAFDRILHLAEARPSLRRCLGGTFLDVGTGVGGIALRAAEACPRLRVDAIDIWEPALRIARARIAASRHAERIRLLTLDVTAVEPAPRYTLAWLPTMFLARAAVDTAVARIAAASQRGAWIVAALYTTPDDPFLATMSTLRTLRGGGEIVDCSELEARLRAHGYVDVEVDAAPIATFLLARRP